MSGWRVLTAGAVLVAAACASGGFSASTSNTPTASPSTSTPRTAAPAQATSDPEDAPAPAATVLYNGRVVTADEAFNVVEGVAIDGGDIVAVGSDDEITGHIGDETVAIDLGGSTVVPGFVDPHNHTMRDTAFLDDFDLLVEAQDQMLRAGITSAGAPGVNERDLVVLETFAGVGLLHLRKHLYLEYNGVCGDIDPGGYHLSRPFNRDPERRLAIAGVKVFADGGACNAPSFSKRYPNTVPEQFRDRFRGTGDLYIRAREIERVVKDVDAAGGITVIHAIGDRANAEALRGLSRAYDDAPFQHHQRIDHNSATSLLSEEDLTIYGKVGMTPVLFAVPWVGGCDPANTDLWQSILAPEVFAVIEDSRAVRAANPETRFSWHSDNPRIPGAPLQIAFTLLTGGAVDTDTGGPCYPEAWSRLHTEPIEEVIRMLTINAALAMGIDDRVGSLEVGKVADLLVLAEDPLGPDPETAIAANRPTVTMIDGVVYHCEDELCDGFAELMAETDLLP